MPNFGACRGIYYCVVVLQAAGLALSVVQSYSSHCLSSAALNLLPTGSLQGQCCATYCPPQYWYVSCAVG